MASPSIWREVLGSRPSGPFIGFEEGYFILYRRVHKEHTEVLVKDVDWWKFMKKVREYNQTKEK